MLKEDLEAGEFDDTGSAASALLWLKRSLSSECLPVVICSDVNKTFFQDQDYFVLEVPQDQDLMVVTHSQETCARNLHKFLASNLCKFMQVRLMTHQIKMGILGRNK